MRFITILILSGIFFTTSVFANLSCDAKNIYAIRNAIGAYLKKNTAISPEQVSYLKHQCFESYAVVKIHPNDYQTDDAIAYLQKVNNEWTIIAFGTHFNKSVLDKIPKALRDDK